MDRFNVKLWKRTDLWKLLNNCYITYSYRGHCNLQPDRLRDLGVSQFLDICWMEPRGARLAPLCDLVSLCTSSLSEGLLSKHVQLPLCCLCRVKTRLSLYSAKHDSGMKVEFNSSKCLRRDKLILICFLAAMQNLFQIDVCSCHVTPIIIRNLSHRRVPQC